MSLLSLREVSFAWGGPLLLDGVNLEIEQGERIGLLGRNGTGKSTMMSLLAGELQPDGGEVNRASGVVISRLVQDVPTKAGKTSAEIVAAAFHEGDAGADEWRATQAVDRVLTRMGLDGEATFDSLSSGMKRRVLLAGALVREPQVLLLDEPTNHLDIEAISWLERFLKGYAGALVFVTHDRVFLQSLATRIVEIDRGRLFDWTCDYATFLKRKEAALEAEEQQNRLFDKKLAQEEVWIRQGIKARRTRNEGRVRALEKMRQERGERRKRIGNVRMQAAEAERSGQVVIEAKNLSFAYDREPIVDDFSTLITRGDKIGIIGSNGTGKTTLLKLLLGELKPTSGSLRHGTRLEPVYFDQLREQIDEDKTVAENVGGGRDVLLIDGNQKHIYGYLQDFLFTPERARRAARFLSGGERNRLLLAKLFTRSSNLLVLDEPTNDLDTETLELLEELVTNYGGTLLLVSHDRAFLNNVVTGTFVLNGDGKVAEYVGGYDDYLRCREEAEPTEQDSPQPAKQKRRNAQADEKPAKLSYKEQRELEQLPEKIEALEQEQADLHAAMAAPDFFKQPAAEITAATERLEAIEPQLVELLERWEELESRA